MKFFPHIDVVVAESALNYFDGDTQRLFEVNTFLKLFNN